MIAIVIEGLEGAGKTTVAQHVKRLLDHRGYASEVVPEFSSSPLGDYLHSRLAKNRFLLDPCVAPTAMTQLLSVSADTAYAFEYTIPALLEQGRIAIKDRGRESVVACQGYALIHENSMTETSAFALAATVAATIPDEARYRFWLDAPEGVRRQRLVARDDFTEEDLTVYNIRESGYSYLKTSPNWDWDFHDLDATAPPGDIAESLIARILEAGDLT